MYNLSVPPNVNFLSPYGVIVFSFYLNEDLSNNKYELEIT